MARKQATPGEIGELRTAYEDLVAKTTETLTKMKARLKKYHDKFAALVEELYSSNSAPHKVGEQFVQYVVEDAPKAARILYKALHHTQEVNDETVS